MDWCCARHHSHWLSQQGSSHNRGTYSRPGPFILFLSSFFPPPRLCLFQSFPSAGSSFPPICPSPVNSLSVAFANTCSLFLPALFKCYGGERCSHPSPPLSLSFLNCSLSEEVGFLLCAALPQHTQTSVLPLWGISIFKKANVDNCAEEHYPSSGKTLKAVWYRRTHTHTHLGNAINWHCFADLQYICV